MFTFAPSVVLCSAVIIAFVSFAWAARSHFVDTQERSLGMRLVFAITPLGTLLTVATYAYYPVGLAQCAVALCLYAGSLALFWWAIRSTQASHRLSVVFSTDSPEFLVTGGPYRYIRHPFYTSYLLFWSAGVAATGALWLAALMAVMGALYWSAAKAEERKFSHSELADSYAAYSARTRMFIPWAL
ncbi:methyltransferase family protein [Microvirga solisilvae]|uniref:methyltransferase family protein n=1 Tax=Microvirga solisilvae TaxID=2919498 RepID=UPI001FAED111|nr:isoprenylcysteine carboxylmethyltransferase family protein [Microvirga solisilvae]